MILTLIFIGIFVIFTALTILIFVFDWGEPEIGGSFTGVAAGLGLLGVLITGGMCLAVNQPAYAKSEEYRIKEKIKLYKNEKAVLESYHIITDDTGKTTFTSDITFETVSTSKYYEMVDKYNMKVYDFKTSCMTHKYNRDNPWLNWFESAAWNSISEEMLDELSYTIGK